MTNIATGQLMRQITSFLTGACVAAILAGCGGGGSSGNGGTTSFASGPIQGLGSVIVNGVRFDDSSARVSSDDDDSNEVRRSSELKVGMVVTIQGGSITSDDSGRRAKAGEIRFGSELVGPATALAVNADGLTGTFKVLGQTVTVDKTTAFDDSLSGGFVGLQDGTVVEVHGLFDAAKTVYTATRVEAKSNANEFKVRGAVSSLNTAASTFKIGDKTINYATITPAPSLTDGQIVRVKVQKTANANGELVAIRIKDGTRKVEDHDEAEIKGSVTTLATDGKSFSVGGIQVDATNVSNLPKLAEGNFVEVEGRLTNGVLIAAKVELEDRGGDGSGEFEFHRRITQAGDHTFDLGTTTIVWDAQTAFLNGTTSTALVQGTCIEVKAVTRSGSTSLFATRIKLDNSCTQ
jgi:Domain of unknown function (DUF5666)